MPLRSPTMPSCPPSWDIFPILCLCHMCVWSELYTLLVYMLYIIILYVIYSYTIYWYVMYYVLMLYIRILCISVLAYYICCILVYYMLYISVLYVFVLVYMLFFWSLIQNPTIGVVFSALHTYVSPFHPSFPTSSRRSMWVFPTPLAVYQGRLWLWYYHLYFPGIFPDPLHLSLHSVLLLFYFFFF